ncbi:MAG TPA: PH domain-containing protein [Microlunatus sp.]
MVMEALFAPPDADWQPISPKYSTMRRLNSLLWIGVIFTAGALYAGLGFGLWWLAAVIWAVALAIAIPRWIVIGRNWRSWGYLERDDDLYITRGVLFRELTAVPYGRMQAVEVRTTPLQRAFGLATVQLVTASAATDAVIPGLLPDEAARLRDRLTQVGEAQASGL